MKALIFNNKIVDVVPTEFEVHESMTWMDCPDDCTPTGWEVVDGSIQRKPETNDFTAERFREARNRLLHNCDWTDSPKNALTDEQHKSWETYRQALRDLPATTDITKWGTDEWVWPTKPS